MESKIYLFPKDLKKNKNIPLFMGEHIAFAAYKQETTGVSRVHVQMHCFILIQKGSKILHTKNGDVKIQAGEGMFLKADHYTLSNIIAENSPYQAILLFFDNVALIEFIAKYKYRFQKIPMKSKPQQADFNFKNTFEIFRLLATPALSSIISSFDLYINGFVTTDQREAKKSFISCNSSLLSLIMHKFEELFLYLGMEYGEVFNAFVQSVLRECNLNLDIALSLCQRDFINVCEMAELANTDQASFSRKFKQAFGLSPKNWLDEKRFEKAIMLLQDSTKNIQEICTECGFSSTSWFIERFKKRYHQTPKQYQKSHLSM
ncbi:helix-turn-helix domain-containing protein [Helicobacter anatolicus]|uniref:helix-turn-helix domain-containing protein n=1 Tax=Helicobacter anatolicus TaxID=2905874 RepID=UPI001E46A019|nr:AraC family transcriptional regulator [Helicobacter anatolicus]MCE3037895.1 AraC family transcriptional regulator [Helicobacter anatolicus]